MDSPAGREHFALGLEARRQSEQLQDVEQLPPCGWCIGNDQFRQELLQQMLALPQRQYGGPEWQETAEKKAQRILSAELQKLGWDLEAVKQRRKGDPEKIKIARRLRSQTT